MVLQLQYKGGGINDFKRDLLKSNKLYLKYLNEFDALILAEIEFKNYRKKFYVYVKEGGNLKASKWNEK